MRRDLEYLEAPHVAYYLSAAREVAADYALADLHVHASEVIFGGISHERSATPHVWSVAGSCFSPPMVGRLRVEEADELSHRYAARLKNKLSHVLFTRAYQHVGAGVLRAEMEPCSLSGALLLPVASSSTDLHAQLELIAECAHADPNLWPAYSVPDAVTLDDLASDIETALRRYRVRAVKLHPNLSGIDLTSVEGVARVERVLDVCGAFGLPVVVHGGRSPILGESPASEFAVIQNLQRIDWRRSRANVIIAHLGAYGCPARERVEIVKPQLGALLDKHDNVMTDCSGLSCGAIRDILSGIPSDRVLFGSDALYTPMWAALAGFLHAVHCIRRSLHETLYRVAHVNVCRVLGLDQQWGVTAGRRSLRNE